MKEIIEKILTYLPKYFNDSAYLFMQPKTFAAEKVEAADPFFDSLVYAAISIAIMALLPVPWWHRPDVWASVAVVSMQTLLSFALALSLNRLVWYWVGGIGRSKEFFALQIFQTSLMNVFLAAVGLCAFGVLYASDPQYAAKVVEVAKHPRLAAAPFDVRRTDYVVYMIIQCAGIFFLLIWLFIAWGAFRQLFGLSRTRSAVALLIGSLLALPLMAVAVLLVIGLNSLAAD